MRIKHIAYLARSSGRIAGVSQQFCSARIVLVGFGMSTSTIDELTELAIGCAIAVHTTLGPGLLESVYRDCLVIELYAQRRALRLSIRPGELEENKNSS